MGLILSIRNFLGVILLTVGVCTNNWMVLQQQYYKQEHNAVTRFQGAGDVIYVEEVKYFGLWTKCVTISYNYRIMSDDCADTGNDEGKIDHIF